MSASDNCKDSASKSSDDGVCDVNGMLNNTSIGATADDGISICANCGKQGDNINNICNKCKQVKYCNATCKKVHKKKHKKDCEEHVRLATEKHNKELRIAADLHDIELFKQPPPSQYGDCPICFLRLPSLGSGSTYYSCCGKTVCCGCVHAPVYDDQGNVIVEKTCPFCRTPRPASEKEVIERTTKRAELDDPIAIYNLGCYHRDGRGGFPQDYNKAFELWQQAGELGHSEAYVCLGYAYDHGRGIEVDETKARYYYELGAMGGSAVARNNLGSMEGEAGNIERAIKHLIIAVRGGYNKSLEMIQKMYTNGHATKDDYTKALQLYQSYLLEIKSVHRDKAAAAREDTFRYY